MEGGRNSPSMRFCDAEVWLLINGHVICSGRANRTRKALFIVYDIVMPLAREKWCALEE